MSFSTHVHSSDRNGLHVAHSNPQPDTCVLCSIRYLKEAEALCLAPALSHKLPHVVFLEGRDSSDLLVTRCESMSRQKWHLSVWDEIRQSNVSIRCDLCKHRQTKCIAAGSVSFLFFWSPVKTPVFVSSHCVSLGYWLSECTGAMNKT